MKLLRPGLKTALNFKIKLGLTWTPIGPFSLHSQLQGPISELSSSVRDAAASSVIWMKEQHQRHDEAAAAGGVCVVSTSSGLLRLHTSAREHPGAVEADGGVCWTQDIPASGKRDTGVCLCVVWLYTPRYTTAIYHHSAQKVQIRTKIQKYILAMKMFQSLVSRVFLITTINIWFCINTGQFYVVNANSRPNVF